MTFTEAAVEVLRRMGKPLHYREIAEAAVRENMLSHVGQDPETTMGQRLAAMARREEERRVVAIAPEGTFALTEWSVPAELVVEAKAPPLPEEDGEKAYRAREREPRPIHSQARRRMEAIAAGEDPAEAERREQKASDKEREKERDSQRGDRDRKRPLIPAEAAFDWLAQRQTGAPLVELAAGLAEKGAITEALAHDLPSLTAALLEDNRRRTEAGRKPAFIVDGERVTLVEFPSPTQLGEVERSPQTPLGRPASGQSIAQESKRACVRALRARLADLETQAFEHVCAALLEKMGMRDVRVAKRSKDGPLYLARHRWGLSDLRVAVRLVRGRREIARQDVLELRKDLVHYSAQMALLLAPGDAGREARAEASAAAQPPVALYAGEALAEELVEQRVGVTIQVVEIADVDEAFFANAAAKKSGRDGRPLRDSADGRAQDSGIGSLENETTTQTPALADPAQSQSSERASYEPKSESAQIANASGEPAAARSSDVSSSTAHSNDEKRPTAPGAAASGSGEETRDGRKRPPRRDREDRPRMATPADQAWGQPAGTPKKGATAAEILPGASRIAEDASAANMPSSASLADAPAAIESAASEGAASEETARALEAAAMASGESAKKDIPIDAAAASSSEPQTVSSEPQQESEAASATPAEPSTPPMEDASDIAASRS